MQSKYFYILIALCFFVLFVASYLFFNVPHQKIAQQEAQNITTNVNISQRQKIENFSDWTIYNNDERGIFFQYPSTWTVREDNSMEQSDPILTATAADGSRFTIFGNFNGGFECSEPALEDPGTFTLKDGTTLGVNLLKPSEEEICDYEYLTEEQKNERTIMLHIPALDTPSGDALLLYYFNISKAPNGIETLRDILATFEIKSQ